MPKWLVSCRSFLSRKDGEKGCLACRVCWGISMRMGLGITTATIWERRHPTAWILLRPATDTWQCSHPKPLRSCSEAMRKNRTWFEIQWPEKVRFWCRSSRNLNAAALNSDERMTLFKPILPQTYTSLCIALGLACAMYFAGWKAQSLPWPMQLNSKSPEAWHISCCATLRWQPLGSSVWSRINDGCKTLSNLRSVMISGMLSQ